MLPVYGRYADRSDMLYIFTVFTWFCPCFQCKDSSVYPHFPYRDNDMIFRILDLLSNSHAAVINGRAFKLERVHNIVLMHLPPKTLPLLISPNGYSPDNISSSPPVRFIHYLQTLQIDFFFQQRFGVWLCHNFFTFKIFTIFHSATMIKFTPFLSRPL